MSVIETRGLTKRYGNVLAVDGISFTVEPGQVFGFLGPNGCGTTTTIGMLLGIITPTAGEVRLLGLSGRGRLHAARQQVGATLETPNFYPYLSGWDNLRIVANLKGVGHATIGEILEVVGLLDRRKDKVQGCSLNRWLAGQGVFVAFLAPQRLSLEDAFHDLTRDHVAPAMAGAA